MGLTGMLGPIGCQDKFYHIVKKNVIGSARIARLCFCLLVRPSSDAVPLMYRTK